MCNARKSSIEGKRQNYCDLMLFFSYILEKLINTVCFRHILRVMQLNISCQVVLLNTFQESYFASEANMLNSFPGET